MSTLLEHLNNLKVFRGEDKKKLWSPTGTALVVNMVAAHLDELIALSAVSPAPESPAKEQPGGQNADVAAMMKRLHTPQTRVDRTLLNDAAALIEKLGQGWIPVSERLPEDARASVLAFWKRQHIVMVVIDYLRANPEEYSHWMPLPPPPERP